MNYSIYLLGSLVPSRGHMMNRGCLRKGHVRKTGVAEANHFLG